MNHLSLDMRSSALVLTLTRFGSWWITELSGCFPNRLKSMLVSTGYAVAWNGEAIDLMRAAGNRRETIYRAHLPEGTSGSILEEFAKHLKRSGIARILRCRPIGVRLHLPETFALRTLITLPLAAEENLREVLQFELDRRTPFAWQDVYFAHSVKKRDVSAGTIAVELTVVQRRSVEAAKSELSPLGIVWRGLEVAGENGTPPTTVQVDEADTGRKRRRRVWTAAIAATVFAAALSGQALIAFQGETTASLRQEVEAARSRTAAADKARAEIERLRAASHESEARRRQTAHVNEVLTHLSNLFPDDTWLFQVELSPQRVMLSGYSSAPANLIQLLDRSPLFESPKFAAAVTRDDVQGKERFVIVAKRATRKEP